MDAAQPAAIGEDMLARALSFAALGDPDRDVLMSPFVEEVFDHEPPESTLEVKAAVAVVVRNSLLEEAHTNGPLNTGGIQAITTAATAPLSHLLAAGRRGLVQPVDENLFASLPDMYPRAWACLAALADAIGSGGRIAYRTPDGPAPTLPEPSELVDAPTAANNDRVSVLSGIDDRFDRRLVEMLDAAAFQGVVLWLSALSRISRNLDKLLRALEFLIAHSASVLTTNYMIRSNDVWARRGAFVKPVSNDPAVCLSSRTGLSGAHKKAYEQIAKQVVQSRSRA
ncbi:hypothetical protein [Amycolatopsis pithecellobii]|uniref:Uncharacterized protein n=1 Tax=Amycolatopsis pithecellobii TaxID=664692 RepID=A0A6N7ZBF4_9PSEU|nr:hypothetical protein [Amycolatopsis pithecellobii]MTD59092.1 hypothetical protein [Amycolatopsis pithecellobii]